MRGNLNALIEHLESKFPAYHKISLAIQKRESGPTEDELAIAKGVKELDTETAAKYVTNLNKIDGNIKNMFHRGEESWNQDIFEDTLARWIVACDQPFTTVKDPEFCELLQYVHQPGKEILRIPDDKSIRRRIMKMGEDMQAKLKAQFAVSH